MQLQHASPLGRLVDDSAPCDGLAEILLYIRAVVLFVVVRSRSSSSSSSR